MDRSVISRLGTFGDVGEELVRLADARGVAGRAASGGDGIDHTDSRVERDGSLGGGSQPEENNGRRLHVFVSCVLSALDRLLDMLSGCIGLRGSEEPCVRINCRQSKRMTGSEELDGKGEK